MTELTGNPGFAPMTPERLLSKHHAFALELIAMLALTISLVIAATAVAMAERSLAHYGYTKQPAAQMPGAHK